MGLNIIIYQALLYVSIIMVIAIIFSYISHKTRKPGNNNEYFRAPQNHMRSIQRNLYAENIPQQERHQFMQESHSGNINDRRYGFETRKPINQSNEPNYIHNSPQFYQPKQFASFRSAAHPPVHNNPVYFR